MENLPLFFFSSRRRHTRCLSDWSSDVCSSDLVIITQPPAPPGQNHTNGTLSTSRASIDSNKSFSQMSSTVVSTRSEERRVGKECRSRWRRYQYKKKSRPHMPM